MNVAASVADHNDVLVDMFARLACALDAMGWVQLEGSTTQPYRPHTTGLFLLFTFLPTLSTITVTCAPSTMGLRRDDPLIRNKGHGPPRWVLLAGIGP